MKRVVYMWALVLMVASAGSPSQAEDDTDVLFWLSPSSASGAPGPSRLEAIINVFPENSSAQKVYIWARLQTDDDNTPAGDVTSIGLNVRATSMGGTDVLDLTRVELDNPLLFSDGESETYRHQFVVDSTEDDFTPCVEVPLTGTPSCAVVEPCEDSVSGDCGLVIPPLTIPPDDFLAAFAGFSISLPFAGRRGVGIGDQSRLYTDPMFDGQNWRIGWFEFVPLDAGTAQIFLQVGPPGIGRSDATEPAQVFFGAAEEAAVLGNEFFAESAEEDALLTIRFMPDYNRNGAVDAGDYTVWRDTLGSNSDLRADGNGDGVVGEQDYVLWKDLYGEVEVAGQSGGSLAARAPEPPALAIAVAAACFVLTSYRRKGR